MAWCEGFFFFTVAGRHSQFPVSTDQNRSHLPPFPCRFDVDAMCSPIFDRPIGVSLLHRPVVVPTIPVRVAVGRRERVAKYETYCNTTDTRVAPRIPYLGRVLGSCTPPSPCFSANTRHRRVEKESRHPSVIAVLTTRTFVPVITVRTGQCGKRSDQNDCRNFEGRFVYYSFRFFFYCSTSPSGQQPR